MDAKKVVKVAGLALSVGGAIVSIAADMVKDKEMDIKIAEKIAEALANK